MAEAGFDIAGLAESLGVQGLPLDLEDRKSCCSALYELEPVRMLLGDTLHPGGLGLTHRLGKLAGIEPDDMVLDLASRPSFGGFGLRSLTVSFVTC